MADENRIITFNYARTTWDQFKKQTIPSSDKCMTKFEINQYLNAEPAPLTDYIDNRLVPRFRFVGVSSSFNTGIGFDNYVYSIAIQSDGKILIGGSFSAYNGTNANSIVRLNTNGSIDSSFNIGSGFNNIAYSIAIQSDGKILIGGFFTRYNGATTNRIVRLNTNGSIDSSFNIGIGFDNYVYSIAIQSDGKILIGGSFSTYNGTNANSIVRLNTNGSIDSSFNIGSGFDNIAYSIAIQSDGKILIGGFFTTFNGTTTNYITRLNTNGSIDYSFNIGTGFNNYVMYFAIQSDDKILAVGYFIRYNGATTNRIVRLNTNGSIDSSFNIGSGFNNYLNSIAIQSDGKILIGGVFSTYNGTNANSIVRLNTNGSIDSSFNIGSGFNSLVYSIAIQSNDKILAGGYFTTYNGATTNYITRLNTNGSIDQ